MGEELAIVNLAVTKRGGGGMTELRRAFKVGLTIGQVAMAQRWAAACHSAAVRTGKAATLSWLREEEGVIPLGWASGPRGQWPAGPTRPEAKK
jgi:hypothetical protein